jgi:hypothetical protein
MKIFLSLCATSFLVISLASAAFSQDKAPLISMDASMVQTQAWLSKAIDKNSTYRSGRNTVNSISGVNFDGCNLSYKTETETQYNSFAVFTGGPDGKGPGTNPTGISGTTMTLAFDLKQMNLNGITLTPLVANSNMQMLTITSLPGQPSVSYDSIFNNPRFNRSGSLFAATMAVKNDVAQQIKNELTRVMTACQNSK